MEIIDDEVMQILEKISKLEKGEQKEIKCPKCGSKMLISKNKFNGHYSANCENDKCITIFK